MMIRPPPPHCLSVPLRPHVCVSKPPSGPRKNADQCRGVHLCGMWGMWGMWYVGYVGYVVCGCFPDAATPTGMAAGQQARCPDPVLPPLAGLSSASLGHTPLCVVPGMRSVWRGPLRRCRGRRLGGCVLAGPCRRSQWEHPHPRWVTLPADDRPPVRFLRDELPHQTVLPWWRCHAFLTLGYILSPGYRFPICGCFACLCEEGDGWGGEGPNLGGSFCTRCTRRSKANKRLFGEGTCLVWHTHAFESRLQP